MSSAGSRAGAVIAADAASALLSARPGLGRFSLEGSGHSEGQVSKSTPVSGVPLDSCPPPQPRASAVSCAASCPLHSDSDAFSRRAADAGVNSSGYAELADILSFSSECKDSSASLAFSERAPFASNFYFHPDSDCCVSTRDSQRPLDAELYDPSLCKSYHALLDSPTPRLATYNIRTFSGIPTSVEAEIRQQHIIANVTSVGRHGDVVFLQETKGPPVAVYESFSRDWLVFDNPAPDGTLAGTAILVRKTFAHNFRVVGHILVPGYIQSVNFEPLDKVNQAFPYFTKAFTTTNVYLHSSCSSTKRRQLRIFERSNVPRPCHFAGGDWNIISHPDDAASGRQSTKKSRKALDRAIQRRGLKEVWHPAKTKLSRHSPPRVSRLDRWFVSLSEGEKAVMEPRVWLPPHPHEPAVGRKSPSDHFPVTLSFYPARRYADWRKIPVWIARDPSFRQRVESLWEERRTRVGDCKPVDVLHEFNDVLHVASSQLLKERRVSTQTRVEGVSLAAAVYSKLLARKVSAAEAYRLLEGNGVLAGEISSGLAREDLINSLGNFLWSGSEDPSLESGYVESKSAFSAEVRSFAPAPAGGRRDYVTEIKSAMVDKKRGLQFLVGDDGERTSDSDTMGKMLKEAWEPVWRGSPQSEDECRVYLSSYNKRVQGIDQAITLADVINEVLVKRRSCPGPNGIPFACYSELCDLAAPILLGVCQFLAAGGAPKSGFNDSTLFFLPKDGTGLPPAHRPIAASNTDNRIIANVVRRKLESAVLSILDRAQTGFVRGRRIEEHIHFFNRKFYNALYSRYRDDLPAPGLDYPDDDSVNVPRDGGTDYYILFLDFAKAYDSVSRRFLFCLLERVGIPSCYINIIRALYHDVKAWPALPGKTSMHIRMPDGLKQGCPLSCLLFILAIDPLVSVLSKVPRTDPAAFADDVAVGAEDPVSLLPVLLHVDAWSRVCRCMPNVKKTKLVSTSAAPVLISHLLPLHWAKLGYVDSYVYLGVLIGRSIDVTMVYQRAVDKLVERARSFMPMQRALTISARVRMANIYLVPILSYLFRFFLMSAITDRQVRAALKMWLIRGNVTNLHRLAAPTHLIGLSGPLHDPSRVNMAAMLCNRQIPTAPVMSGRYSMLMSDHVQHAAISFQALAGAPCPSGADQRAITGALLHRDAKPLSRLVRTMGKRLSRQGRPGAAKDVVRVIGANSLRLPGSLCSALRNHAFNVVHQCLFTGHRARRHGTRLECAFCGAEREDDCHLFVECKVAKDAIASLRQRRSPLSRKAAAFLVTATVDDHHLESPGLEVEEMRFLLCFSLAVWKTRRFFWHEGPRPTLTQGAARVALEFESLCRNWKRGGRRDRDAEKRAFEAALRALPPGGVHVYTDGSSYGNPGPSGAGVAVYSADGGVQCLISRALGAGTNNSAELAAILAATEYLLEESEVNAGVPITIFVDNRTAMAVALGRVVPSWGAGDAAAVCRNVAALSATRPIWFIWVPGHAGVPGNEAADRLAKLGAADVTGMYFDLSDLPQVSEPDVVPAGGCAGPSGVCDECLEVLRSQCALPVRRRRRQGRVAPRAPPHRYNLRSSACRTAPSPARGHDGAVVRGGVQPTGLPVADAVAAPVASVSLPSSPPVEVIPDEADEAVPSGSAPDSPCSWGYGSGFGSGSDVGSLADVDVDAALLPPSPPRAEGGALSADPAAVPISGLIGPSPPLRREGLTRAADPDACASLGPALEGRARFSAGLGHAVGSGSRGRMEAEPPRSSLPAVPGRHRDTDALCLGAPSSWCSRRLPPLSPPCWREGAVAEAVYDRSSSAPSPATVGGRETGAPPHLVGCGTVARSGSSATPGGSVAVATLLSAPTPGFGQLRPPLLDSGPRGRTDTEPSWSPSPAAPGRHKNVGVPYQGAPPFKCSRRLSFLPPSLCREGVVAAAVSVFSSSAPSPATDGKREAGPSPPLVGCGTVARSGPSVTPGGSVAVATLLSAPTPGYGRLRPSEDGSTATAASSPALSFAPSLGPAYDCSRGVEAPSQDVSVCVARSSLSGRVETESPRYCSSASRHPPSSLPSPPPHSAAASPSPSALAARRPYRREAGQGCAVARSLSLKRKACTQPVPARPRKRTCKPCAQRRNLNPQHQPHSPSVSKALLRVGQRKRKHFVRVNSSLARLNNAQPSLKKRKLKNICTAKPRTLTSNHNSRNTAPPKGLECIGANFPT